MLLLSNYPSRIMNLSILTGSAGNDYMARCKLHHGGNLAVKKGSHRHDALNLQLEFPGIYQVFHSILNGLQGSLCGSSNGSRKVMDYARRF